MEVLYRRCAGLDVHKELVVACVRIARGDRVERETARFGTTTRELLRLQEWLLSQEVTHVAMESTGVYWKPVWHILAGTFELTLGNARAMRNVPGRKSDQNDASWIADLLAHGLIKSSFVPEEPVQELRDLTRTRKQLMHERARYVQRLQKILEDANVKLASVLSDITGASGRKMLTAIINGSTDARAIARLADPRVKAAPEEVAEAVEGCVTDHHRFMLRMFLHRIDSVDADVAVLDERIEEKLGPFREAREHLISMSGVSEHAAASILAEIGADMSVFPTEDHLVSWAGLAPGLRESGGKKKPAPTQPRRWLRTTMVQCAWAGIKARDSYLSARYHRIRSRRGKKKAIIAVAATMMRAIYHMLKDGVEYRDLGPEHFDRSNRVRAARRLKHRLEKLGYRVDLQLAA